MGRLFVLTLTIIAPLFWATGCATSFEVVQLPERSADLYPLALTQGKTTVAVDEIRNPDRVRRYFGIDLLALDIVPVNIVVSNHTEEPVLVKPADVLLHRDNEIIDPLPVEQVAALAKRQGRLNRETREQVDAYYRDLAFKTTVVAPNDTYQGILFFPIEDPDGSSKNLFRRIALWMQGDMQLDVVVETARGADRLRFGPFGLAGPSRRSWF
jgi:hypothetical protein